MKKAEQKLTEKLNASKKKNGLHAIQTIHESSLRKKKHTHIKSQKTNSNFKYSFHLFVFSIWCYGFFVEFKLSTVVSLSPEYGVQAFFFHHILSLLHSYASSFSAALQAVCSKMATINTTTTTTRSLNFIRSYLFPVLVLAAKICDVLKHRNIHKHTQIDTYVWQMFTNEQMHEIEPTV